MSASPSAATPPYHQRITHVLRLNEAMDNNENEEINENYHDDIYDAVHEYYDNKGGINQFFMDYFDFINNMDNNRSYTNNNNNNMYGLCELAHCKYIERNYRNKNIFDHDNKRRFQLYKHSSTEQSVVIQQILDIIHICRYHMIDLGFRVFHDKTQYDQQDKFTSIRNKIIAKRQGLKSIHSNISTDNNNNNNNHIHNLAVSSSSKFMTHVFDDNDDEKDGKYPQYSSGIRYYYHDYYKNNNTRKEIIPGTRGDLERGNAMINGKYKFSTWYIAPKYKSLKVEVLEGAENKLSIIQYENSMKTALSKFNSYGKHIQKATLRWEQIYGIKRGSIITLDHIIAITFYTDYTELSSEFSTSYRRLSADESDETLKKRHQLFANWARLMREAVEVFGTHLSKAPNYKLFYHGITKRMVFSGFCQRFCGPTSCTLSLDIAVGFANQSEYGDGIVISINNNGMANTFFDCKAWSKFPWEWEVLFVGGLQKMDIIGLITIPAETRRTEIHMIHTNEITIEYCFLDQYYIDTNSKIFISTA